MTIKVCVCGGGNGAHTLSGLAASRDGVEVRVLTLFADEAERWTKALGGDELTVIVNEKDGTKTEVKSRPKVITKDPVVAISGADVVVLTVPAFAHEGYFQAMAPHVQDSALIVGLPSQAGFEFQCRDILGDKAAAVSMMSFETLPWACRIKEFGKKVEVLGTKSVLAASLIKGTAETVDPLSTLQMLHGAEPVFRLAKHFLEMLIMSYSFVHPAILYGRWGTWDGKPVAEAPLFYQGIDQATADMLTACSDECKEVANAIMAACPGNDLSDVKDIYQWYLEYYHEDIQDDKDLYHAITTNKSYKGLVHPVKAEDGGVVPDFGNRYLTEDIPMGMIVFKGVAIAAGVPIPKNDKLIMWAQEKIGKEYLVDGALTGKDVATTRCPQRYGFNTLNAILTGKKE
ncbi:octopine dehydrogenase [Ylistrum balloti]|uniref:octopine dehydrogenase n=1 Tax=Ylistrum balloti TaxID=509963 RepID=UPI002905E9B7|nr:octopine dehydrogenase [Ylistrum balloti]